MIARHGRRGGIKGVEILLFLVVIGLLSTAAVMQHDRLGKLEFRAKLYRQRIKLPSADAMRLFTLGYDNMYANWLWLQSIQAFGSGWITDDGTTEPIFQYFDTMTDFDPTFIPSYRFGNLIIGDNRFDFVRGQALLRKGCIKNPMNYSLPYLGLYNAIFQTGDLLDARWFAHRMRRITNAPPFMRRMEEYIERQDGRFEAAFDMNVRFYIEYIKRGNTIEREIIERRMVDVVDRLAKRRLTDACWAYAAANDGRHPRNIEDVLRPEYLPPFRSPYLPRFVQAMDAYANEIDSFSIEQGIPDGLVEAIVNASKIEVHGLPAEPRGTWYFIQPHYRENFERVILSPDLEPGSELVYLTSAYDIMQDFNMVAFEAQGFIMNYVDQNDGRRPDERTLRRFLGRDMLGGHLVYQPEAPESPRYGVYFSTAMRRISDGQEPRMGARGVGPFPLPLTPSLFDFEVDYRWGIESGYIQANGEELLFLANEEPNWEREREAHQRTLRERRARRGGDASAEAESPGDETSDDATEQTSAESEPS